ncbi:hypothetical protein OIU74_010308, partial [Salix koriyanagi]
MVKRMSESLLISMPLSYPHFMESGYTQCCFLILQCLCHQGLWILRKTWQFMGTELLHGRKEWRSGRKSRVIIFRWSSTNEARVVKTMVEMNWTILICL